MPNNIGIWVSTFFTDAGPDPISGWQNFYIAEVGAGTALAGLLTIAASINLKEILATHLLPKRMGQMLLIVICAIVVASIGLFPFKSEKLFGIESSLCGIALATTAAGNFLSKSAALAATQLTWRLVPLLISGAIAAAYLIGGGLLMMGSESGVYVIGIAIIVSMVATIHESWILLVEILR